MFDIFGFYSLVDLPKSRYGPGVTDISQTKTRSSVGGLRRVLSLACILGFAGALSAEAKDDRQKLWADFGELRSGDCLGEAGTLAKPIQIDTGKFQYELRGSTLFETSKQKASSLKVGVVSATKDDREITISAIKILIDWMKSENIQILLANGDLATNSLQMGKIFSTLASSGVIVVAYTGNTESCGSFNRIATSVFNKYPNFLNGNWVRKLDLNGAVLVTLPGYYDKRFTHVSGAAHYRAKHIEQVVAMFEESKKPVIFTSHGPPKMKGKHGIDIASGVGHVGDQEMTDMLDFEEVSFGIFGHILEAGGLASNLAGNKRRKQNKWYKSLFINAGAANPDPWPMLNGKTTFGMGAIFELKGSQARYKIKYLKKAY